MLTGRNNEKGFFYTSNLVLPTSILWRLLDSHKVDNVERRMKLIAEINTYFYLKVN